MKPTVGRTVVYKVSEYDAAEINQRRSDAGAFHRTLPDHPVPSGELGRTGHVEHHGNAVAEGDEFPAVVVRTFGGTTVNLQVQLDGNDHYWATSRSEGEDPGFWSWPPRAEREPGDRPERFQG